MVKSLQYFCTLKICKTLSFQSELCKKYSFKIPDKFGEKIFRLYTINHEFYNNLDLNFFRKDITSIKSMVPFYEKFQKVQYFDFLNGHHLKNLIVHAKRTYPIKIRPFQLFVDHLTLLFGREPWPLKMDDGNYFIDCITKSSIIISGHSTNDKISTAICTVIRKSDENLEKISIDIEMTNNHLKNILESIRYKKNLINLKIKHFIKCTKSNNEENCQSFMTVNNFMKSEQSQLERIKFGNHFCFYHTKNYLNNFKYLKNISLKFKSKMKNDEIEYLNNLFKYYSNNLREIYFEIGYSKELYEKLCKLLKNCHKLEDFYCKISFFPKEESEKIIESLSNSVKTLKQFRFDFFHLTNYLYKYFIKNCCSLSKIIISRSMLNEPLTILFKNSLPSITNVSFNGLTFLTEQQLFMLKNLFENLNSLKSVRFLISHDLFDNCLNELSLSSNTLEYLDFQEIEINNENFLPFISLIRSCTRLKEIQIKGKISLQENYLKTLINSTNFTISLKTINLKMYDSVENDYILMGELFQKCQNLTEVTLKGDNDSKKNLHFIMRGLISSAFCLERISFYFSYGNGNFPPDFLSSFKYFPCLKEYTLEDDYFKIQEG